MSEASGWQPIETAPKDGTEIDLWVGFGGGSDGIRYPGYEWSERWNCWRSTVEDHFFDTEVQPTHWMPVMPPPVMPKIKRDDPIRVTFEKWSKQLDLPLIRMPGNEEHQYQDPLTHHAYMGYLAGYCQRRNESD